MIRDDARQQFRLHYGEGKVKEKDFNLFMLGAKWMANWLSTTSNGFPTGDEDLISVGFIRRRAKELESKE